jgi:hypothetical protein
MKIHFFTIVLNGMPFIKYHLKEFEKLSFPWHWHVVEGLANLKGDTGWGLANGARIPDGFHNDGLSIDGTTAYLNSLPWSNKMSVYRAYNRFWDSKTEMVNVLLNNVVEDCLLWQIDHDELWRASDIEKVRDLFINFPEKHSAYFYCYYFLGPKKYIISENVKSTRPRDWMRVWRYRNGMHWMTHEPPILLHPNGEDVGQINSFTRNETEVKGLFFQHFAYSTLESVKFKEIYYGYKGLTKAWEALQFIPHKITVGEGFPGVDPGTVVDDWDESKQGELLWKS